MRGRGFSDAPAALTGARRILLVRLDNIGDVVLLSPAIASTVEWQLSPRVARRNPVPIASEHTGRSPATNPYGTARMRSSSHQR